MIALLVVAALLLAELGVRIISPHFPPHQGPEQEIVVKADQLKALARQRKPPDVVFVGPSTTDAGIDPQAFNLVSTHFDHSYNAALKGMTLSLAKRWVARTVLHHVKPKLVVVNVQPTLIITPKAQALVEGQKSVSAYNYFLRQVEDTPLTTLDRSLSHTSELVRYRSDLQNPTTVAGAVKDTLTGADEPKVDPEDTLGYARAHTSTAGRNLQYRDAPDAPVPDRNMAQTFERVFTSGVQLADTESLLRWLQAHHYPVVVMVMPIDMRTLVPLGLSPTRFRPSIDGLSRLDRQLGVPTLDYSDINLDPLAYHDKVHLADGGARDFSQRMAADIDDLCAKRELRGACP